MSEPIGLYLMPLYAIVSWYGLYTQDNTIKLTLPVALVGWLWAGVNIQRTRRLDLGIVTFFCVLLAALGEHRYGRTRGIRLAACGAALAVALNFSLVLVFWRRIRPALVRSKSDVWAATFWSYCACMTLFWALVAVKTYERVDSGATLVGS